LFMCLVISFIHSHMRLFVFFLFSVHMICCTQTGLHNYRNVLKVTIYTHIFHFRKARDIHYMKRIQSKYATNLGVKANKLQRHFRPQVNF
jgi:hypothetical protein